MKTLNTILMLILICGPSITFAQDKAINYKELQKYLPSEIMGYSPSNDVDGNSFEMNGMSYSTAVQDYKKGNSKLTISIIDYHGATNLYTAATMAWSMGMSYEDDDKKAGGIEIDDFKGWHVYEKKEKASELVLAFKERYIITIVVTDVSEGFSKSILKASELDRLP